MKRLLTVSKTLLAAAALCCVVTSAHAGGINLSWGDCGPFGAVGRTSACTVNTGAPGILVASAIAPAVMGQFNGVTSVLDIQTTAAAMSPWWQMGAGQCRVSALSGNANFVLGPFNCYDVWAGGAAGGINYAHVIGQPRARLKGTFAIAGNTPIDDVTEMYIMQFIITNAKTTGTGSCAGCLDGACIQFNELLMTQPLGVGDYRVTNPITRSHVTWQASGAGVGGGCPGATPTKNATWGSVKSLYR